MNADSVCVKQEPGLESSSPVNSITLKNILWSEYPNVTNISSSVQPCYENNEEIACIKQEPPETQNNNVSVHTLCSEEASHGSTNPLSNVELSHDVSDDESVDKSQQVGQGFVRTPMLLLLY